MWSLYWWRKSIDGLSKETEDSRTKEERIKDTLKRLKGMAATLVFMFGFLKAIDLLIKGLELLIK